MIFEYVGSKIKIKYLKNKDKWKNNNSKNYQRLWLAYFPTHIYLRVKLPEDKSKPKSACPSRDADMPYCYKTKRPKIPHIIYKPYNTMSFI